MVGTEVPRRTRAARTACRPARTNADVYLPVSTEPVVIEQEGPSHYVGIQFTPWGARSLFPDAPERPEQVETAIGPLPDPAALADDPASVLDRWLRARLPATLPTGVELLRAAVDVVDADPSAGEVADLADRLHAAPSTLYRAFRRRVGLSPKQYVQIMRYRAFTDALIAEGGGAPTTLLAGLAGYADQAHAARDFSRFTGMAASRFRDTHDGIAALMARTD
jgi:AraC-like DNA-binding protein